MSNQPSPDREKLEQKIYDLLYHRSRVEGIRYINEDEWPIKELADLTSHQVATALGDAKDQAIVNIAQGDDGSAYSKGWYRAMDYVGDRLQAMIDSLTPPQEPEKPKLKPFNHVIQVCPDCGTVDVYEGDGHICDREWRLQREADQDYD